MFTSYQCPLCGHALDFSNALFRCPSCGGQFGVIHDIPLFGADPGPDRGQDRDAGKDALTGPQDSMSWERHIEELFRRLPSDDARAEQANLLFRETRAGWKYLVDLSRAECALVLGAGTGTVSVNLCRSYSRVFVLDPSLARLESAGKASRAKGFGGLHLVQGGDTAFLPFPAEFFDLICLNGSQPEPAIPQQDLLAEIHRTLKPGGSLYFPMYNRLSYHAVSRAVRGFFTAGSPLSSSAGSNNIPQKGGSFFGIRRTLHRRRFKQVDLFSLWPDHRLFYEIFFFGDRGKRPKVDGTMKQRLKRTLDRNRLFCPSFGVVARKQTDGQSFLQKVLAFMGSELSTSFRVDAYYVTAKGNVIADIADRNGPSRGLIVKIPVDGIAESQNSKNYTMLSDLHGHPLLAPEIKKLIPRPMGTRRLDGQQFSCEEKINGIHAGHIVNNERIKDKVLEQAVDFLLALHQATLATATWSEGHYDEKIGNLIERVGRAGKAGHDAFDKIDRFLRSTFIGREISTAHRHGDFSFANIVIDPKSHRLTGIIDWDGSSPGVPILIDMLNVIESVYNFKDRELGHTITQVLFRNRQSRGESEQMKRYLSVLGCTGDLLRPCTVLYWLYHLDSQLKYGHLAYDPRWMRDNYHSVLRELNGLL